MKCGDIWLINFDPGFGHEYKKTRPGLIIENDSFIEEGNIITIVPLTSTVVKKDQFDVLIKKDKQNRLMNDSIIKVRQISTFDKRRLIKYIGESGSEIQKEVKRLLKLLLV